jgi:hypothetical protein
MLDIYSFPNAVKKMSSTVRIFYGKDANAPVPYLSERSKTRIH